MHNLKEIRKNFDKFKVALEKRSVDIDFNQFHYRFRLDLYGYPRFLEVLSLLTIHLEYKKNVSSKKYVFFSLVLRFISLSLFEILRIINPRFISDNFKKLFNKLLKIFINIIKSNSIIYDISKKIKKWSS